MAGLRERNKQKTLDRICDALLLLLEDGAYEDVRVDELIARAEISKQTFYNFFPDKRAVLTYIVERRMERWSVNTGRYPEWKGSAREKLSFLYNVLAREVRREKGLWQAVRLSGQSFQERLFGAVTANVRGIIEEGQRTGEITRRFKAERLANHVTLLQLTICLDWTLDRPRPYSLGHRQRESLEIFFAPVLTTKGKR
jgi:AcrR family transcriptional regulator